MKITTNRISNFLKGRGFYMVLAFCLVAIGVAAWTAWAGATTPDTAEREPGSNISSSKENTDKVQQDMESEPYESSSENVPSKEEVYTESIVAENFVYPVGGAVLKAFSDEELVYSKTFGDLRLHIGLDLECEKGTAVGACGNGVVVAFINDPMLGNYVEVDHGNGIVARYCGLADKVSVKEGHIVSAGTKLGLIGEVPNECADDTHLHLEFYKDEIPVNPEVIIEG